MELKLKYTPEAAKAYTIATGKIPRYQTEVPLGQMTPEQRALIVEMVDDIPTTGDAPVVYAHKAAFVSPLVPTTPEEWVEVAQAWKAATEAAKRKEFDQSQEQAQKFVAKCEEALTLEDDAFVKRVQERPYEEKVAYGYRWKPDRPELVEPELDARARDIAERVQVRFTPLQEEWIRKAIQRDKEMEALKVTARQKREDEKAAWIAAHGSEYLRKATGAGYDCQRRYVEERAALEYPGYWVDFDEDAQYFDRAAPSEAALDEALRVGGQVVWRVIALEDEYGDTVKDGAEAVRVVLAERYSLYKMYENCED